MTLTRGFIRNAATTPLDARLMDAARHVGNNDGSPRVGVIDGDGRALVTALGTMAVSVAAADFGTSKGTADGLAVFTNDGAVTVPISAAPASNSRITVIWVKHNDTETGDANALPIFGTTDGAAAASPTKPAIPTGALELATLRVYAGTTAANGGSNLLTNTYQMTAARGGVVNVRNATELAAWTNAQTGQRVFNLADRRLYTRHVTTPDPTGVWVPDRAAFIANRANAQALGVGGWWVVAAAFDTPSLNDLGVWSGVNGTLVVRQAGVYRVHAGVKLGTPTNPYALQITRNSSGPDVNVQADAFINGNASSQSVGALVTLAAGDVLRLLVYTSVANTIASAHLSVELVSLV
ncbi:minor tail protein [Microbacterium phage OscarSo]|uniref:Minor tail protein n=1 Tax=Microbacterium phage OscarSo TaxID=2985324 RepID=A0A9X9K522_9CAUD|nr:minor tail protein [Microbacterium phage OscarSo]UYL87149.1 minor tail protein [Microbacterium phage OscarSo]